MVEELRDARQLRNRMLRDLRQFLRQCNVSGLLSLNVMRQVSEREQLRVRVTSKNLPALEMLSSDMRVALLHELILPFLTQNAFWDTLNRLDSNFVFRLCLDSIELRGVSPGEE